MSMNKIAEGKHEAKFQEKEKWLQVARQAEAGSLKEAVAWDKLVQRQVVPDDPIVEANDDYWEQFKQ